MKEVTRDTNYYNQNSADYENSRYVTVNKSAIHYLFNRRREIATEIFKDLNKTLAPKTILEVACADGVMSKVISDCFPESKIIANDIAKEMVEIAKKRNLKNVDFYERGREPEMKYDLVIYLGVYNILDSEKELEYVRKILNSGGVFVVGLTHKSAWSYFFKRSKHKEAKLETLEFFENEWRDFLLTGEKLGNTVFIPYLWRLPFADYLQHKVDWLMSYVSFKPFHEVIYVLKKKD